MKKFYIDSCRDDNGFIKATDCLQSHEDTLRGNSIEVVEYSALESAQKEIAKLDDALKLQGKAWRHSTEGYEKEIERLKTSHLESFSHLDDININLNVKVQEQQEEIERLKLAYEDMYSQLANYLNNPEIKTIREQAQEIERLKYEIEELKGEN